MQRLFTAQVKTTSIAIQKAVKSPMITRSITSSSQLFNVATPRVPSKILVAHLDSAGTIVDPFCSLPLQLLKRVFDDRGIAVPTDVITKYMGLKKIDHVRQILLNVSQDWQAKFKRAHNEQDIKVIYAELEALMLKFAGQSEFTKLTPHTEEFIQDFQKRGIVMTLTSGYPQAIGKLAVSKFREFYPDSPCTFSDEVTQGTRSEMIMQNMKKLSCKQPALLGQSVFFTDAKSDLNCVHKSLAHNKPWLVGVSDWSTHVGVYNTQEAFSLSPEALAARRAYAAQMLASAHLVIPDMSHAVAAVNVIEDAMAKGATPDNTQKLTFNECINRPRL